jgi:penicillin-binding protein 1C
VSRKAFFLRGENQGKGFAAPVSRILKLGGGIGALLVLAGWLFWLFPPGEPPHVPAFQTVKANWRPSEAYLLDRNGELLQELRVDFKQRRMPWTPLEAVSPALPKALLAAEDRRFWQHRGVDWRALAASLLSLASHGPRRGGSTLSMQLAAMLSPALAPGKQRRGPLQKLAQMRAALALEARWSKAEILEAYLNLAGFRGELQGVAASARAWFGKQPSGLSETEAILLAAILPAPQASPQRVAARACAIARAQQIAADCEAWRALASRILSQPAKIEAQANLAPHLARRLLKHAGESLRTTLDARLQGLAHEALAQQLRGLSENNVRDGAALVIDNASGEVLVYVGSAGPFSKAAQNDGVLALRQAGSTLKPFLYALAVEKRYLTAASLLNDAPIHLETPGGLYIPQNYERDYKGRVSVRTALASSLNIPAVRTLVMVGVERFRDWLNAFGYASIRQPGEYYGYSLALGSAEVSLFEQVNAYRALANGGMYSPLRLRAEPENLLPAGEGRVRAEKTPAPRPILSPATAFIISDMLSDRAGRSVTFGLDNPLATRFWSAVKTGTSKDMRDNWCIGYSSRYTVGVWVGNFEGDSMRETSGVSGAAPAWLDIMNALHAAAPSAPPAPPQGLLNRAIRFEPALEPPRSEWFLAGTELEAMRAAQDTARTPRIASPANGVIIALDPDIPYANQTVFLTARPPVADADFVLDGTKLAPAAASHPWKPKPGLHKLVLLGKAGKVLDTIHFSVRGLRR